MRNEISLGEFFLRNVLHTQRLGTMRKRAEIVFHAVFKNIIFVGVLFTDWEIQ